MISFCVSRYVFLLLATIIALSPSVASCSEIMQVLPSAWENQLIPLPKKIEIAGSIEVPANKIRLNSTPDSVGFAKAIMKGMADFLSEETGVAIKMIDRTDDDFEIRFALCDSEGKITDLDIPECKRILSVENSDQAYVIFSENRRLTIAALTPQGLHYGAMTLQQLVLPFIRKESGVPVITLPIITVVDWPDLPERGFWGHGYVMNDFRWFSAYKLNVVELYTPHLIKDMGIDSSGKGWVKTDDALIDYGYHNGVKVVPVIFHIDQLHLGVYPGLKDMYKRYPDMKVKYTYKTPSDYFPCGSSKRFIKIMADWLSVLASNQHVTDISVWLSEWDKTGCSCKQCRTMGRQSSETKAMVTAWKRVRQKYPNKHLWLLPYTGSSGDVLSVIPQGSNIHVMEYNYSLKKAPIIPAALSAYSSQKNWIGVYPLFAGSSSSVFPSHLATLIHDRMGEFYQKNVRKVSGYTGLSSLGLYDFNMSAAAEWAWNHSGRTIKEFAFAYAKKKQFEQPDKFAEWINKIEPIEQRLRYLHLSSKWFDKSKIESIGTRRIPFGQEPLQGYLNDSQLINDGNTLVECKALAKEIDRKEIVQETAIVEGYLRLLTILAKINTEPGSYSSAETNTIKIEIDSATTDLLETLECYYTHEGDSEEKWFLRKSRSMLIDNIKQISQWLTLYAASGCIGVTEP